MAIHVRGVGHVVLKVRDLERSASFYREVIGLTEVGRLGSQMVFFSATGQAHGITRIRVSNHRVSQSIYLSDPDGNGLELFVDADPAIWRANPAAVAHVEPLEL